LISKPVNIELPFGQHKKQVKIFVAKKVETLVIAVSFFYILGYLV
jgi:hypothetical protein